jgi:hypothetical protein
MVRVSGEAPLPAGGARLARALPRLRTFTLALVPRTAVLSRAGAGLALAGGDGSAAGAKVQRAAFELVHDAHGLPVALRVREARAPALCVAGLARVWDWGLGLGLGLGWGGGGRDGGGGGVEGGHGYGYGRSVGKGRRVVRYVLDLRPVGHPGARARGVTELLFEKSAAGEETRLIVFCVSLVTLAVCGFVGVGR